ncbi:MAG: undecaprenyl/decaprenyl-phosphate alpha-N-acetylglucosaminyl 1-phosphate transferase [Firmicutes bacterium]|nr:undecaprenyl/decaprenyl-phosphate alpha-N-acetylglucosaminyl 1-phosphate transferase [Bacillota bacterium]
MAYYLAAPVLALVLGFLLTPPVRKLAVKVGALDYPDQRKVHSGTMPRMGGLAVYAAFVVAVLVFRQLTPQVLSLLAGATAILFVGMADDIYGLPAVVKLVGQILAALVVVKFGIQVYYVTNPLNGQIILLGWLAIPLTVFWIVAVTNAVNLIDGLDGLAGGVSCIAALTIAAVTWTQFGAGHGGMTEMIMLALTLVAAVAGFLRFNFHPAKIFLGDTGSMFLGFTLAVLAIMSLTKSAAAVSVIIPLVILGVPLLDTFFAIFRRCYQRRPIFQPDKHHLHHQLMAMGLNHRQTVLVIYGLSAFLGLNAVVINLITSDQALVLLVILAVAVIYLANRVGVLGRTGRARMRSDLPKEYKQRSSKM